MPTRVAGFHQVISPGSRPCPYPVHLALKMHRHIAVATHLGGAAPGRGPVLQCAPATVHCSSQPADRVAPPRPAEHGAVLVCACVMLLVEGPIDVNVETGIGLRCQECIVCRFGACCSCFTMWSTQTAATPSTRSLTPATRLARSCVSVLIKSAVHHAVGPRLIVPQNASHQ